MGTFVRKIKPTADTTIQSHAETADTNQLMNRYKPDIGQPATFAGKGKPMYGDFTKLPDLQQALNQQIEVMDAWKRLPHKIRAYFQHNPKLMCEFVSRPENRAKCQELGLIPPDPPTASVTPPAGSGTTPAGSGTPPAGSGGA